MPNRDIELHHPNHLEWNKSGDKKGIGLYEKKQRETEIAVQSENRTGKGNSVVEVKGTILGMSFENGSTIRILKVPQDETVSGHVGNVENDPKQDCYTSQPAFLNGKAKSVENDYRDHSNEQI